MLSGYLDQETFLVEIMFYHGHVGSHWSRSSPRSWVWKLVRMPSEQNATAWTQREHVGSRKIQNCWKYLEKCYVLDHCVVDTDELLGLLLMCFEHPVFDSQARIATEMTMNEILQPNNRLLTQISWITRWNACRWTNGTPAEGQGQPLEWNYTLRQQKTVMVAKTIDRSELNSYILFNMMKIILLR